MLFYHPTIYIYISRIQCEAIYYKKSHCMFAIQESNKSGCDEGKHLEPEAANVGQSRDRFKVEGSSVLISVGQFPHLFQNQD